MMQALLRNICSKKRLNDQHGFSFIEILMVVVIICILAGMMAPGVVGAINEAKKKACQANYKSLEFTLERYYAKEGKYPDNLDSLVPEYIKEVINCPVDPSLTYGNDYQVVLPDKQSYQFNHLVH